MPDDREVKALMATIEDAVARLNTRWPGYEWVVVACAKRVRMLNVGSTLSSRAAQRGVLMEAIALSVIADGATPENVSQIAKNDYEAFQRADAARG